MRRGRRSLAVGLVVLLAAVAGFAGPAAAQFTGGVFVAVGDVVGSSTPEIVTGPGPGGVPLVRVFDSAGTLTSINFFAYDPFFTGGVRVALCDVDGDGVDEILTAPGPGHPPEVRVWKVTTDPVMAAPFVTPLTRFLAYDPGFRGGVYLACGDLNHASDGRKPEIVTGAGEGGSPLVKIWNIDRTGPVPAITEVLGFLAYPSDFLGGVRVAVNRRPTPAIVTGAGPGGTPHVRQFSVTRRAGIDREIVGVAPEFDFFAYDPAFQGGVHVAKGNFVSGGTFHLGALVTGPGPGGGPHVVVGQGALGSFFAYDPAFGGGVTVAVGDVDGDFVEDIVVTGAGPGGGAHVKSFAVDGTPGSLSFFAY